MKDIFDIRRNYSLRSLNEEDVDRNPIIQFENWLEDAIKAGLPEPNALTLSTVGTDLKPSSRVVLLKQVQQNGFVFFSNYQSRKAEQLDENPSCALNFLWLELERQIRIEGIASKLAPQESDDYFNSRPKESKLGAWASPQSKKIPNREFLEIWNRDLETEYKDKKIPRPPHWGGYLVEPYLIEFWQGRPNRLHDRICYYKEGSEWKISRLAP